MEQNTTYYMFPNEEEVEELKHNCSILAYLFIHSFVNLIETKSN